MGFGEVWRPTHTRDEEGSAVLRVLAFRLALERLVARLEKPGGEEDATVRRG